MQKIKDFKNSLADIRNTTSYLTGTLELVAEMVSFSKGIEADDRAEFVALAEELAESSLAFQRHVDSMALLAKVIRRHCSCID